ncbi:MAG: phosphoribosyl-ATP diphosphatase [Alphaproteobacteria bacterium]
MSDIVSRLFDILTERKNADPEKSYVASLYQKGTKKITEKVIEEAHETVVEALSGDNEKLKTESADLLFHLMVLWADRGIMPGDVFSVLEKRLGVSGHDEKAARKK